MHRGVIYGVIAFGLAVGLGAFAYAVPHGVSLPWAVKIFALLVGVLIVSPLKQAASRSTPRGDRRETIGVAMLCFALLVAAGGVIVGIVGGAQWLEVAGGLLAIAVVVAAGGTVVLRGMRRKAPDAMSWHP